MEKLKNRKKTPVIIGILLIIAAVLVSVYFLTKKTVITLTAQPVKMLQDEKLPEVPVKIDVQGKDKKVLDKEKDFRVKDLIRELKEGKDYKIIFDTDGKTEGKFNAEIRLSKDLKKSLDDKWSKKLVINVKNSKLTVQNKYGKWEKEKFKKWDGSYAANEFIVSKGDTYYFDSEGKTVTGEKKIGYKIYKFSKEGILLSEELCVDPEKPMIALTFDDGPGERTSELLDVLEANNARATFFMVGPKVSEFPDVVKRMYDIGCELGNHTTHHPQLTKLTPEQIKEEIDTTTQAILTATGGTGPTLVRPPYGAVNDTVKQSVDYPLIMWSVDTKDWKTRNAQMSYNAVMGRATDGDIVLMHDIHSESIDAAIQLVPQLVQQGYQLVTVSELAEARGVTLESGERYSQIYK